MKYKNKYEELRYAYLDYHDKLWDSSTYRSESSKTKSIIELIEKAGGFSGVELYKLMLAEGYKPYTIKVFFQRAGAMYKFGMSNGIVPNFNNPYSDFIMSSAHLFRNAYKTERLKLDYDEALIRINTIPNIEVRDFCIALLRSGLRINEAYKINYETSSVVGKGDKERFVVFSYEHKSMPSESMVRRELAKIGLKPHSLRKLLATKLSRSNMTYTDICAIFGWSSLATAQKYLQPLKENQLKQKMKEILG